MCGIVGLSLARRHVTETDLRAMNAAIVHRGPDGEGTHTEGRVGIGMRRLAIIDIDGGVQPISNETGRIHVVQNGEIYNYRELRRELEELGHQFHTSSDTESIVHAYEEWGGREFANHLRGMFAIAIYDSNQKQLWVARDRIGVKPLFLADTSEGFGFASEIKALAQSPLALGEVNPRAIVQYLAMGSAGHQTSFLRHVRSLPPGCVACFSKDTLQVHPYWRFQIRPGACSMSYEDAREELKERLHDALRSHLVSDVSVGAFLSGGVDSSAIVGMMARELGSSFKTFSIGFEEDAYNELPHADEVSRRWGTEHHVEIVRPSAVQIIDQLVEHFDEPFADSSAIPTWYVSRLAAESVKVVLSGDGGDELFAGYERYAEAHRYQWIDWVPQRVRQVSSWVSRQLPDTTPGRYFMDHWSHDACGRFAYQLSLFPPLLQSELLKEDFRPGALGMTDPLDERRDLMRAAGTDDLVAQCMYLDTQDYLPLDIMTKVDRMTMAHSLEARPPLLDHHVVEFAAHLPTNWKLKTANERKAIFKDCMRPYLPPSVCQRKKAGFAVPLQAWFARDLADMFRDLVMAGGECHAYLEPATIQRLFHQNLTGRRDHGNRLWAILVLEIWLRRTLHPSTSSQLTSTSR